MTSSRSAIAALSLVAAGLTPQTIQSQQPRSVTVRPPSGAWIVGVPIAGDTLWQRFTLRFERDSVTGANAGGNVLSGSARRDSVRFSLVRGDNGATVVFAGTLRGDSVRGTRVETPKGTSTPLAPQQFVATPEIPARPPHGLAFSPRVFHRAFSGSVAPALRIVPGDTVRTWSVDAGGADSSGKELSPGGNPLTGPFFVEGALPGDVIAIKLHRVRLNRDYANAGDEIVWNALTPDYVRGIKYVDFESRWKLDRIRGVAMLEKPTSSLRSFSVPLRPMLGCIGVAPQQGQVIRSQDSGPFGGNMDYNAIREGSTVYLPVFRRGALLFVGDGHAVQGDGELTGDALETSMNIEFSVDLLRQQRISTPRAEDDEFLMAIGINGDLSNALRDATTSLSRWLETDYAINSAELASILGVSMRYDVADLVGTQVSIVAKVPKAALRSVTRASKPNGGR